MMGQSVAEVECLWLMNMPFRSGRGLIGLYLATSMFANGTPYFGDGLMTSDFPCLGIQRVSNTCILLLEINRENGLLHWYFE